MVYERRTGGLRNMRVRMQSWQMFVSYIQSTINLTLFKEFVESCGKRNSSLKLQVVVGGDLFGWRRGRSGTIFGGGGTVATTSIRQVTIGIGNENDTTIHVSSLTQSWRCSHHIGMWVLLYPRSDVIQSSSYCREGYL